jgi:chromosome segregation ATPase
MLELNVANVLVILIAFIGALWGLVKIIAGQQKTNLDSKLQSLSDSMAKVTSSVDRDREATRTLERQLMELRVELPRDYVRREDFIRAVQTIETKIDNMALRMERALDSRGGDA